MDRRRLLAALGAFAAPSATRLAVTWADAGRHAGAAEGHAGVLAWGAGGACLALPGGQVLHWADAVLAPQPVAGGLWLARRDGRVQHVQIEGGDVRTVASFDSPVPPHAMRIADEGRWLFVAAGEQLVTLDAQARVQRRWAGEDLLRRYRGRAAALFAHAGRRSLVAAWPALGELWEIPLDPAAPPHYDGLVHDWRFGEGIATPGFFSVRRSPLGRPMADVAFADARLPWVAGTLGDEVHILHLNVRRRIATLPLPGARAGAALWRPGPPGEAARARWWLPAGDAVQVVETRRWTTERVLRLPGAVRQLVAAGDATWALVDAAQPLWRRSERDDAWHPVTVGARRIAAIAEEPVTGLVLAATQDPIALLRIEADGRPAMRWPLGDEVSVQALGAW
jgi:hypothetical protein